MGKKYIYEDISNMDIHIHGEKLLHIKSYHFLLGKQMEDQTGKGTLTTYLIVSFVDMSSYFNCHQHTRLKLQAGNAKQGLWEEEISFPRAAGVAEKKSTSFQTQQPFCRSENELFSKAKCMFTMISQSLVGYTFIRRSLRREVIGTYEVKRMIKGRKEGGVRERGGQ